MLSKVLAAGAVEKPSVDWAGVNDEQDSQSWLCRQEKDLEAKVNGLAENSVRMHKNEMQEQHCELHLALARSGRQVGEHMAWLDAFGMGVDTLEKLEPELTKHIWAMDQRITAKLDGFVCFSPGAIKNEMSCKERCRSMGLLMKEMMAEHTKKTSATFEEVTLRCEKT